MIGQAVAIVKGNLNPRMVSLNGQMEQGLAIVETEGTCKLGCLHCNIDVPKQGDATKPDFLHFVEEYARSSPEGSNLILKNAASGLRNRELELVRRSVERGLFTTITTEGLTVPEYFQDGVVALNDEFPGRVGYTVSLDGSAELVHRQLRINIPFDRVVDFIQKQIKRGVYVETNFVAHSGNLLDFKSYVDFVTGLGVAKVNVLPLQEIGAAARNGLGTPDLIEMVDVLIDTYETGTPETKEALEHTIGGYFHRMKKGAEASGCEGCPAGSRDMIMIDSRGDIYPCNSLRDPQFKQGNIGVSSLADIYQSERFRRLQDQLAQGDGDSPLKFGCPRIIEKSPEKYRAALDYLNSRLEESGIDLSALPEHGRRVCFARTF
ncbi:MAG: radical SAM protein [Candidatus Aenigmarchaeota archaeon]|nr:radical SAM protein [Candidatus Aenigmarchaeota archaeon]